MEREPAQPFSPKLAPETVTVAYDQWNGTWILPDIEKPLFQQRDPDKRDDKGEMVPRYVTYVARREIGGRES